MALFDRKKRNGGFMDEIRCDEPSYLIWKWHPSGSQLGENQRENSVRWGSSLRVKDGEVAVFVYKQKNGEMQDFVVGPFDQIIKTANLPVLSNIVGLAYEGGTPFQAEIYFINLARIIQVKFGVPFFDVYDPRFGDFGVPIAVRGTVSFGITNYREFIKLHRLSTFSIDEFKKQIKDAVSRYVKDTVASAPAAHSIPVVQIESKIAQINDAVEYDVRERLSENFGISVSGVDIAAIEIDKTSDGYRQLMAVTKDITTTRIQAETVDYEERLRIQREEDQYALHMRTRSTNLSAYQVEKQAEVGVASATAFGQMGANGGSTVDLGGGMDFNPAAMMAGLTVGSAIGKNLAGVMNGVANTPVPPPIQEIKYYVAINGQATGPYELSVLCKMIQSGQLSRTSLVWKEGMAEWSTADTIDDLKALFGPNIPPIPSM